MAKPVANRGGLLLLLFFWAISDRRLVVLLGIALMVVVVEVVVAVVAAWLTCGAIRVRSCWKGDKGDEEETFLCTAAGVERTPMRSCHLASTWCNQFFGGGLGVVFVNEAVVVVVVVVGLERENGRRWKRFPDPARPLTTTTPPKRTIKGSRIDDLGLRLEDVPPCNVGLVGSA